MRPWNEQDERDLDTIAAIFHLVFILFVATLICGVVYAVGGV
jgi:hypothetical protein